MRIFFIHSMFYFMDQHLSRGIWIPGAGYEENYQHLMEDLHPATGDALAYHLSQSGHEVFFALYGCDVLQSAWAAEHNIKISLWERKTLRIRRRRQIIPWLAFEDNQDWHRSVLAVQICSFKPDIIFNYAFYALPVEWLRSVSGNARLIGWVGTEKVPDILTLKGYDLILTNAPKYIPLMRSAGIQAEYLPHGFDERVLSHFSTQTERDIPVSFVGSYGSAGWGKGLLDTEIVARETGMLCYGSSVNKLSLDSAIRRQYGGSRWGIEMYRIYAHSKIVFNRHADVPLDANGVLHDPAEVVLFNEAGNVRLYEATGIGALLVTDRLPNLDTLFEPEKEVATYETGEEAVEKIRYYLEHDAERERIAQAGQRRTLRDHTCQNRASQLVSIIGRCLQLERLS
jgi:hypothetical protein